MERGDRESKISKREKKLDKGTNSDSDSFAGNFPCELKPEETFRKPSMWLNHRQLQAL